MRLLIIGGGVLASLSGGLGLCVAAAVGQTGPGAAGARMSDPAFFGYGSLVNLRTHGYDDPRPATLHGWRRVWRAHQPAQSRLSVGRTLPRYGYCTG